MNRFTFLLVILSIAFAKIVPHNDDVVQHYGYINVNPSENANLFYWMFESQNDPSTDPFVLWMTGGPGCSSELALFFENGPYTVNPDLSLSNNPYSWNTFANLLYVDQPVGTGYSYANEDYVQNETQMAVDMYSFLQQFFTMYPQYAMLDFYIIGESYGGHYVPALAAAVVTGNAQITNVYINLVGIGIGNGWTDPLVQYGSYGPFAYANNLINEATYQLINSTYQDCVEDINNQNWGEASYDCGSLMQDVLDYAGNINYYDIDLQCNPPPLCYDLTNITNYLNLPDVLAELRVASGITWGACNDEVNEMFSVDIIQSYRFDVPYVLKAGVRVMVYSGMLDLICNYFGGAMWTSGMKWPGQTKFNNLPLQDWTYNGDVAGHVKSYQGFTWLEVEDAGHMVPHDQPAVALQMLNLFLNDQPFN